MKLSLSTEQEKWLSTECAITNRAEPEQSDSNERQSQGFTVMSVDDESIADQLKITQELMMITHTTNKAHTKTLSDDIVGNVEYKSNGVSIDPEINEAVQSITIHDKTTANCHSNVNSNGMASQEQDKHVVQIYLTDENDEKADNNNHDVPQLTQMISSEQ